MVATLDRSSHKVAHALRIEIDNLAYALQRQQSVKDVEQRLLEINRKLGGVKSDPHYKELREHFLALTAAAGIFLTVATTSHYQVNPQIFQPTSIELRADTSAGVRLTSTTQILNEVRADFGTTSGELRITSLMHAIIGQESNGKFNITNPHSGALGYGQVMPENVAPWSLEALGYALTPKEFLNSPKLQLKIIKFKLGQAIASQTQLGRSQEEIIRRAAAIWYSGQARLWNSNKPEYFDGHPYPSISEYTHSVWERYQDKLKAKSTLSELPKSNKPAVAIPTATKPQPKNLLSFFFNQTKAQARVVNPVQQDLAQKIVGYMERQGYEITRNPNEVNIVHIRNGNAARDRFEDKRIILQFDATGRPQIIGEWDETTKPGLHIVRTTPRRDGAIFISEGQYHAWQVGVHYGMTGKYAHEALIQVAPINGLRDSDRDGIPNNPVQGNFGVNIHGPWSDGNQVEDRSAGCMVTSTMRSHREFMEIVKRDRRYQANRNFVFTATVIDSSKL